MASEAQAIEKTEFAEAAAKARGVSGSEFEADTILKTIVAEEQERVAEAIAFAEVLAPMLAKRLSGISPPPAPSPAPQPRRAKAPALDQNRGIADFIDDMLAQERSAAR
jgi:hypothetical protein